VAHISFDCYTIIDSDVCCAFYSYTEQGAGSQSEDTDMANQYDSASSDHATGNNGNNVNNCKYIVPCFSVMQCD
jgi:hypothetical protein